jgi:hypothetical protein
LDLDILSKELLSPQNIPNRNLNLKNIMDEYNKYNNNSNKNDNLSVYNFSVKSKKSEISSSTNLSKSSNKLKSISETNSIQLNRNLYPQLHNSEKLFFTKGCNEWDEIVKYNKKLYDEEKLINKLKDIEIKKRIKEDLENQMIQKIKRNQEEFTKQREYDEIMKNHCNVLEDLEKQRLIEAKEMAIIEKENRDRQLLDEQNRKKMEILKEKNFDMEYVKNILLDLEKDKQIQLKKRKDERELMHKTILENKLNKQRQLENKERERLFDIRLTGEYGKVLDKQEQQRNEYFKRIERNEGNFMYKMAEQIKIEMENKNKDEELKFKMYLIERENRYFTFF